jgi:hypothetical protein
MDAFSLMLVASLLALELDLFNFVGQLTEPKFRTLAEAIFLTPSTFCVFAFVLRRLRESRHEVARNIDAKICVRDIGASRLVDGISEPSPLLSALRSAVVCS